MSRFTDAASARGVDVEVHTFPAGTRTAADAAAAVGCDVGAIVKSLVFIVDGVGPVVVLTSGSNRVDTDALAKHFDAGSSRQATPDEVREATGYAIGGTPPFGHASPLPVLFDPALLGHPVVWSAAGTPDSCFSMPPADLVGAANAEIVDVTVH
jgi:prolyl-tRNA editing enzyme YbaK/EbsC (Cys-tRNA(Pro) deacylase)